MAAELVNSATSEKLTELDWTRNINICELVSRDQRQARDVIKAIKKRLGNKSSNTQLFAVMLLEMLMNNIGEPIHKQVVDTGILPILVKIVKKKSDLPVREKIFLLLDATQSSLGGASGKFPQYYTAYYDLVSAGIEFPQRPRDIPSSQPTVDVSNKNNIPNGELSSSRHKGVAQHAETQIVPESSIIQKAANALEVLKDVLDAVDAQHPEGAKDEFTLDLVEQCSFQKQRVMHLVMTSQDEKVVSRAIDLNDQLQKVLARHDALLSGRSMPTANHSTHEHDALLSGRFMPTANHSTHEYDALLSGRSMPTANHSTHEHDALLSGRCMPTANHYTHEEAEEEEEAEQLFRRIRKGKACARPEDEELFVERPQMGFLGASAPGERLNRPLIRPLLEPSNGHNSPPPPIEIPPQAVVIPPPPAKHIERERFFQENRVDGSAMSGHMRGLSLHSRNPSSSHSGSIDSSD